MKKLARFLVLAIVILSVFTVSALAAGTSIDYSTLQTSMQSGMNDTVQMLMALMPIGITLFSVVFAAKKAISFFKGM